MKSNLKYTFEQSKGRQRSQFLKRRRVLASIKTWKIWLPSITSVLSIKTLSKEAYKNKWMIKKSVVVFLCRTLGQIFYRKKVQNCVWQLRIKNSSHSHTLSQSLHSQKSSLFTYHTHVFNWEFLSLDRYLVLMKEEKAFIATEIQI